MAHAGGRFHIVHAGWIPHSTGNANMWSVDPAAPLWVRKQKAKAGFVLSKKRSWMDGSSGLFIDGPPPRTMFASVALGGKLFIFGGTDSSGDLSFSIALSLARARSLSASPSPSLSPSCTLNANLGPLGRVASSCVGFCFATRLKTLETRTGELDEDLWMLDPVGVEWTDLSALAAAQGSTPPALMQHAMASAEGLIVLFGGRMRGPRP